MKRNGLPAGRQGSSLMELLIVIAIIGILISVSVVSYSSAQKKGRDSRRRSDMKALQNAWEQYYADHNANYPSDCEFSETGQTGLISATYLPAGLPVDPKTGNAYSSVDGWGRCSATEYCFCAGLEGVTNTATDCSGSPAPTEFSGLACVRSLQ